MAYLYAGDEAGDVSFAFTSGASRHFVLVVIQVEASVALDNSFSALAAHNSLHNHFEFSFHRLTNPRLRERVMLALSTWPFRAWAIVVDKTRLPETFRVMPARTFYAFFLTELLRHIPETERAGSVLVLDEFDRGGRLLADLGKVFKARRIARGFSKVSAKRSGSSRLIQCADLVAGAVWRRYARQDDRYLRIIQGRLAALIDYAPDEKPPS
jgi:hypothetical protein